jgi:predicted nucleic acid-binding Zn ribbon protein
MKTYEHKCSECGEWLEEVGGIGKEKQIVEPDTDGTLKAVGIDEIKLHQCPECKSVELI